MKRQSNVLIVEHIFYVADDVYSTGTGTASAARLLEDMFLEPLSPPRSACNVIANFVSCTLSP